MSAALDQTPDTGEQGVVPAPTILERMGFRVGEFALLLPAQSAHEVVLAPPASRLPNTAPWLLGLANLRGSLVPLVSTATAFGTTREGNSSAYALILGQGDGVVALVIDGLPRLLNIDPAERIVGNARVPAMLERSVVGAYTHGGRTWLDIDVVQLLDTLSRTIVT